MNELKSNKHELIFSAENLFQEMSVKNVNTYQKILLNIKKFD